MTDTNFMDVPLCSRCKHRSNIYDFDHTTSPCFRFPDIKSLKEARAECDGKQWVQRPWKIMTL